MIQSLVKLKVQKVFFNFNIFCTKFCLFCFPLLYTTLGVLHSKSHKIYLQNITEEVETMLENNLFSVVCFSIGNYNSYQNLLLVNRHL